MAHSSVLYGGTNPDREHVAKVLLVDDEPGVLHSTRLLLTELGFEVVTRTNPSEVVDAMREERPDVLLQDVRMPGLDVDALMQDVRLDPEVAGTPVLLFSAGIDLEEVQMRVGAAGFLEKPFKPDDVIRVITRVVDKNTGARRP